MPARRWRAAAAALFLPAALLACAGKPPRLLLAPMVHGVDLCAAADVPKPPRSEKELAAHCRDAARSPAALIDASLSALGPPVSGDGRYELGYTMPVPLLALFKQRDGAWTLDSAAIDRLAATLRDSPRPAVLHLFSTHFGIGAPLEAQLAADPANLAVSPLGPMPRDRYFGIDIFPWSPATTDNDITRYRRQAIEGFLAAVCRLPDADRRKVKAVTLLGELHQFHADFERGMGLAEPYVVSDYSEASIAGFRRFLAARFGDIAALNRQVGENFASFDDIEPPGLRPETLPSQHLDSAAHGQLPLAGWAHERNGSGPLWIRIYRDGAQIARVPARFGRQDVLQAMPAIGTADVGWRYDMDFTTLPPGEYRLDFVVERADGSLAALGARRVLIAGTKAAAPRAVPRPLPVSGAAKELDASLDHPPDGTVATYNPLVPLWHEFRNRQVVDYLRYFEAVVRASCLADVPLFTHQIAPFVNPGWDATRFAVDASLRWTGGLGLGISLYGEATYGSSFFDWLDTTAHRRYVVTEFHPLRAMSAEELAATFDQHRRRGARFVSFFLDVRPPPSRDAAASNRFAFDPDNPQFGSDSLYKAVQDVMRR